MQLPEGTVRGTICKAPPRACLGRLLGQGRLEPPTNLAARLITAPCPTEVERSSLAVARSRNRDAAASRRQARLTSCCKNAALILRLEPATATALLAAERLLVVVAAHLPHPLVPADEEHVVRQ